MASSSSSDIKGSTKSRSRLCHECQHVVNRLDSIVAQHWDFERIPFHDDALSIHSSAENGCLLCGQILWILEGLISMKQRSYDDVKISIEIQKRDTNYTIFGLYSTSIAGINRAFFIEVSQERGQRERPCPSSSPIASPLQTDTNEFRRGCGNESRRSQEKWPRCVAPSGAMA